MRYAQTMGGRRFFSRQIAPYHVPDHILTLPMDADRRFPVYIADDCMTVPGLKAGGQIGLRSGLRTEDSRKHAA